MGVPGEGEERQMKGELVKRQWMNPGTFSRQEADDEFISKAESN